MSSLPCKMSDRVFGVPVIGMPFLGLDMTPGTSGFCRTISRRCGWPGTALPRCWPKLAVTGLISVLAVSGPASAQSASFRSVDTNRDGVLSYEELVAQFGAEGALRLLSQSDMNGDNRLTIQELRG